MSGCVQTASVVVVAMHMSVASWVRNFCTRESEWHRQLGSAGVCACRPAYEMSSAVLMSLWDWWGEGGGSGAGGGESWPASAEEDERARGDPLLNPPKLMTSMLQELYLKSGRSVAHDGTQVCCSPRSPLLDGVALVAVPGGGGWWLGAGWRLSVIRGRRELLNCYFLYTAR